MAALMRPHAYAQVVPDGWAAHHRPVVAGFFADTVTIRRRTGRTPSGPHGSMIDIWSDLATGIPGLVQVVLTQPGPTIDSTGNPVTVSGYYARVDVDWLPGEGDRLIVTASADPALLGTYVVRHREAQGHVVDRTLHLDRVNASTD